MDCKLPNTIKIHDERGFLKMRMQGILTKEQEIIHHYFFERCGGGFQLTARKIESVVAAKKEAEKSPTIQALFQENAKEATQQLLFLHGLLDSDIMQNADVFQALQTFLFAN